MFYKTFEIKGEQRGLAEIARLPIAGVEQFLRDNKNSLSDDEISALECNIGIRRRTPAARELLKKTAQNLGLDEQGIISSIPLMDRDME